MTGESTVVLQVAQAKNNEIITGSHYWLFVGGTLWTPLEPPHKASIMQNVIPCCGVTMGQDQSGIPYQPMSYCDNDFIGCDDYLFRSPLGHGFIFGKHGRDYCFVFFNKISMRPVEIILGKERPAYTIQIKICAEYRDMLPRPRLVCQEPGLRPIGRSPDVPDKSSRGLGSMSRYSAQILICFISYIFLFLFLCGFGWEHCRTASIHSALYHCPL